MAFAAWCNEHGGILGREIVVDDLDAALTEYEARITEACEAGLRPRRRRRRVRRGPQRRAGRVRPAEHRRLRGVGARRAAPTSRCSRSRTRSTASAIGRYLAAKRDFPDGIAHYGIMAANLPSVLLVRDQLVEVAESLGFTVDYDIVYAAAGRDRLGELRRRHAGEGHQDPRVRRPARRPRRARPRPWTPPGGSPTCSC